MRSNQSPRLHERPAGPRRTLVAVICVGCLASPVTAQTLFQWPDTVVDVARYTSVEECLAAVGRVRRGVERSERLTRWRDTMPFDPQEKLVPAATPVKETAVRCAARFAEPAVDVKDFAPLLELYVAASRDSDAAALVTRRLAGVRIAKSRASAVDSAVAIYLQAQPARLAAAEELLSQRIRGSVDRIERLDTWGQLMEAAQMVGDTARARRAAQAVLATFDTLTPAERHSERWEQFESKFLTVLGSRLLLLEAVIVVAGEQPILDSLRRSTASYVNLLQSVWAQTTGLRRESFPYPYGERAPRVAADFWFPPHAPDAPDASRPSHGRVSVVEFLARCCGEEAGGTGGLSDDELVEGGVHAGVFAVLRRLAIRFPDLDITLVTKTQGYAWYALMESLTDEANWLHSLVESEHPPQGAALAVATTPFWRLPAPDGRRINTPVANDTSYSFGKRFNPGDRAMAFLFDKDGLLVQAEEGGFAGSDESKLGHIIDVLLHREATIGNGGALPDAPGKPHE